MYLFNQILNSFAYVIGQVVPYFKNFLNAISSISINGDIYGTNISNITILVIGIIYLGKITLSKILPEREKRIVNSIRETENRLRTANLQL